METISQKTRHGRWAKVSAVVIALGGALAGCAAETDATEDDALAEADEPEQDEVESKVSALSATGATLFIAGFGADPSAGGWDVAKHPRFAADVTGDGRADVVGFGNDGVYVAPSNNNSFGPAAFRLASFGYNAGGWRVEKHPRFLADVTGDGRADVVGFGDAGVWVSRAFGNGFFTAPARWVDNFGYDAGGWRVEKHPRFLADVNADGRADVVGFGYEGVWVSLSTGSGFTAPGKWVGNFGYDAGGWRVEKHPRLLADVNGDHRADVVGFGSEGVWVSLSTGTHFTAPAKWVGNYAYDAGGWRVEKHPRALADVNGDGRADVVGFGNDGVWVSTSTGGGFRAPRLWIGGFGYDAGGWRVPLHPRLLGDVNGDGRADVVGFGNDATWVALSTGARFNAAQRAVDNFSLAQGWQVARHPRLLARVDGNDSVDIVGFGNPGTFVSRFFP